MQRRTVWFSTIGCAYRYFRLRENNVLFVDGWIVAFAFLLAGCAGSVKSNGEAPAEEKQEETSEATKSYHIGDVVRVGDVEYIVNGIEQSDTMGDQYLNTSAQNHFMIVDVTITNKGNEALGVSSDYLKLKNGDKVYDASSDASIYLGDSSIIFETVNPDASMTGKIVFEITQETIDSPELSLQVQTGAWGTETEVIHLK